MLKLKTAEKVKIQVKTDKKMDSTVGLVPTMGALHEGHYSLVNASKAKCDRTVVSIFVNPAQFNEKKDFDSYPSTLDADLKQLEELGVDYVFVPSVDDVYPEGLEWPAIDLGGLENILEGEMRPGHFAGVAKVVYRLFDIVEPDFAFFGQKDFQQTVVIRHMVEQLELPVQIVVCPTIRESNGLAMSSRNVRMSEEDRSKAGFLYRALVKLKENVHYKPLRESLDKTKEYLASLPGVEVEYFAAVNGRTMHEVNDLSADYVVCVAVVRFGGIRMLDNIVLKNEM